MCKSSKSSLKSNNRQVRNVTVTESLPTRGRWAYALRHLAQRVEDFSSLFSSSQLTDAWRYVRSSLKDLSVFDSSGLSNNMNVITSEVIKPQCHSQESNSDHRLLKQKKKLLISLWSRLTITAFSINYCGVVPSVGLEPTTFRLRVCYSNQLSYEDILRLILTCSRQTQFY